MTEQANLDTALSDLPEHVRRVLADFIRLAATALADDLASIVLFGSAAEGRLHETSDVNLLVVLKRFSADRFASLHAPLRHAHATIELNAMFVLEDEIEPAAEAFAVKFLDIHARHRVLVGDDPVSRLTVSPDALRHRLRQVLVNLSFRLRERYAVVGDRPSVLVPAIAAAYPALRSCAGALLSLAGRSAPSPNAALDVLARELEGRDWPPIVEALGAAHDGAAHDGARPGAIPPAELLVAVVALCEALRRCAGV